MKALVTGSSGFIGRHITVALEAAGYEVTAVDTAGTTPVDCREYFRHVTTSYDVVVHAAATAGSRGWIDLAPLGQAANLEMDAAMFAWAARTRPGRVIYLSSAAVYPVRLQRPSWTGRVALREDDVDLASPALPDDLHGWAKLTGELLAGRARVSGLAVTVARLFSVYGEGQEDCYPFPAFTIRARDRQDPFPLWGDGKQVRDWIHVQDVCATVMTMIADDVDGPVNLATGRPVPMRDLAGLFCSAAGYAPGLELQRDMPAGVRYRVADVTRMHQIHVPKISLEEGIRRALA